MSNPKLGEFTLAEQIDWGFWTVFIAALTFIAAIIAVIFYRRQALAAEGDLAPNFDMSGQRTTGGEMGRALDIDVTNHNRRTIHIQAFWMWAPKGIDISFKPSPAGVFNRPQRWVPLKFEMPVAPATKSRFHFTFRRNKKRQPGDFFRIRCTTIYRVEGKLLPRWGRCSLQVQR